MNSKIFRYLLLTIIIIPCFSIIFALPALPDDCKGLAGGGRNTLVHCYDNMCETKSSHYCAGAGHNGIWGCSSSSCDQGSCYVICDLCGC